MTPKKVKPKPKKAHRYTIFVSEEAKQRLDEMVLTEQKRGRRMSMTSLATDIILQASLHRRQTDGDETQDAPAA